MSRKKFQDEIIPELFWIRKPSELICSKQIIPTQNMPLCKQLNAFSRFTILVSLVSLPLNPQVSFTFLFLSLSFIIILYYIQKGTMKTNNRTEYFKNINPSCNTTPLNTTQLTSQVNGSTVIDRHQSLLFCNDEVVLSPNDPNFVSINQALAGPPNPKTLIAPVVTPPLAALDYWKANNLINHSHINTESQYDTYLSGYNVSNCCDRLDACLVPGKPPKHPCDVIEAYDNTMYEGISDKCHPVTKPCGPGESNPIVSPQPVVTLPLHKTVGNTSTAYSAKKREGYKERYTERQCPLPSNPEPTPIQSPQPTVFSPVYLKENVKEGYDENVQIKPNRTGWVNTTCGYNPSQLKYNLPTNLAVGNCDQTNEMKQFNKNLFMQNIQPDIYTHNEIIEPINANIGISFTQQFEPVTCTRKDGKGLTYTEHDPRLFQQKETNKLPYMGVTEADVYDPRFSGYGTSYRSYTEGVTGQTRFYYDDVNAIRMPNYISRSNIDFASYADTYGPMNNKNRCGNIHTNDIRALAQDTFLRSSLQQRTELQERLMRKRNNELWQLRKYPMHTSGSYQSGMKRC